MNLTVSNYLNEVYDDWQSSLDSFPRNIVRGDYWPVPFFGNPATARVATIGANPSSKEFDPDRRWPNAKIANRGTWKNRLKSYFEHTNTTRPADWFAPWTI